METKTIKEFELQNKANDFEKFIKQYLIDKPDNNSLGDDENIGTCSSIEDINGNVQRADVKDALDATEAAENVNLSDLDANPDKIPDIDKIFDFIEDINRPENDIDDSNYKENDVSNDDVQETVKQVALLLKTEQDQLDANVIEENIPDYVFDLDGLYDSCNFAEMNDVNDCKELQNQITAASYDNVKYSIEESNNINEENIEEHDKCIEIEISQDNTVTMTQVDNSNDKDSIVSPDDDSDYCEGYNSSDFEFISESEAKTCGLVANRTRKTCYAYAFDDNSDSEDEISLHRIRLRKNTKSNAEILSNDSDDFKHTNDIKPSTSHANTDADKTRSYYNTLRVEYLAKQRVTDRERHVVPEGDEYYGLFANVLPVNLCFADKALRSVQPMNMRYEGIGFDMNLVRHDLQEEIEYKDEADATARMILEKFPGENRRARRFKNGLSRETFN